MRQKKVYGKYGLSGNGQRIQNILSVVCFNSKSGCFDLEQLQVVNQLNKLFRKKNNFYSISFELFFETFVNVEPFKAFSLEKGERQLLQQLKGKIGFANALINNRKTGTTFLINESIELQINQKSFRKQKEMETPFIKKVKKILEDPENAEIICWNEAKTTIEIKNEKLFQQKVLSIHFRHSRISSFVRQLNLYGFKKIRSTQNRIFTHSLLSEGMGLDSIIHKKKKQLKSFEDDGIINSNHCDPRLEKNLCQGNGNNSKKDITSEYRISQNLIFNKQNSKEDKAPMSTKSIIAGQEPSLNTIWFVPVPAMQQQIWKFPCGMAQEDPRMNYIYNTYRNWC